MSTETIHCSGCSTELPAGARFCSQCGKKVDAESGAALLCLSCSQSNPAGSKFCFSCGFKLDFDAEEIRNIAVTSIESKVVDANEYNVLNSWKAVIFNGSSVGVMLDVQIQYLDEDGFEMASAMHYDVAIEPVQTRIVQDSVYIETHIEDQITTISASLRNLRFT